MLGYTRSVSALTRVGICVVAGYLLMHSHQVSAAEPSLQQVFDEHFGTGVIDTTKETGRTNFPPGAYIATYVARYTANTQAPIGSYPVGHEFDRAYMFYPTDTLPKTVTLNFSQPWALWIDTNGNQNNGRWRSEYWWNSDGADHYKVFDIPWGGYAVGIEGIPGAVDGDFQDHVLAFETGPRPPPKLPLILIPGVMGSEFAVKETFDPDIRNCLIPSSKYKYIKGDTV